MGNTWCCVFLDQAHKCEIYQTRPVECRLLKCWDTRPLLARYNEDRLSRLDLFGEVDGLGDLIRDHESRCSIEDLRAAVADLEGEAHEAAVAKIGEIVAFDRNIRKVMEERQPKMFEMVDLLLGRSIEMLLLGMFQLKVREKEGKLLLVPDRLPTE